MLITEYLVVVISLISDRIQQWYRNRKTFCKYQYSHDIETLLHSADGYQGTRKAHHADNQNQNICWFSITVLVCSFFFNGCIIDSFDFFWFEQSITNCVCWGHGSYYRQTNEEHSVEPSIYRYCSCTYLSRCGGQVALPQPQPRPNPTTSRGLGKI